MNRNFNVEGACGGLENEKKEFENMLKYTLKKLELEFEEKKHHKDIEKDINRIIDEVKKENERIIELENLYTKKMKYIERFYYKKGVDDGIEFSKLLHNK